MKTLLLFFCVFLCYPVLAQNDFQTIALQAGAGTVALVVGYLIIMGFDKVFSSLKSKKRTSPEYSLGDRIADCDNDIMLLNDQVSYLSKTNKKLKKKYKRLHQDFVDTLTAIQQYNVPTVPLEEVRAKIKDRLKEEESQPIPMPPFSFEVFGDNEGGYVAESWLHNGKHIEIKEPTLAKLKDSIRVVLSENINTDEMPESVKLVFVRKETFEL